MPERIDVSFQIHQSLQKILVATFIHTIEKGKCFRKCQLNEAHYGSDTWLQGLACRQNDVFTELSAIFTLDRGDYSRRLQEDNSYET